MADAENTAPLGSLERLTLAIERQNELLEISNAGREAAIAAAEKVGAAAATTGRAKPGPKPKDKEPEKVDYTGEKGFAALQTVMSGFMSVEGEDEKEARKATFKTILAKVEATKLSEIAETDREKVVGWVKAIQAGEDVPELAPEAAAPAEDDLMG